MFNTPDGRYRFLLLPYGILSAPEVYHKTIHMIFEHIPGVETVMDDIIVCGSTREEHNERLRQVLDKTREVNLKLNTDKCEFEVKTLTFVGYVVSEEGVKPDPRKSQQSTTWKDQTTNMSSDGFWGWSPISPSLSHSCQHSQHLSGVFSNKRMNGSGPMSSNNVL